MKTRIGMLCVGGILTTLLVTGTPELQAQRGETITVDAITFDDEPTKVAWGHIREYDKTVVLPPRGKRYERILIEYTLKCDAATSADRFACGEWDYSTFIRLFADRFDSSEFIELGRFITPYGIGLSLGPDGFRWVFDVTDYGPLLHDTVRLTAGNNQELLHLRFVFVEGIPTRDPLEVRKIWSPGNKNYQAVVDDEVLSPVQIPLAANAAQFRVNVRPQGGNFNGPPDTDNCAEFCNRRHSLMIGGTEVEGWNVWNECGDNPVYPQGGTWLTDRAGWCPGAIVTTRSIEITEHVTPGETVEFDYDIDNPEGFTPYGHWVFASDLVSYGPANFTVDADLREILSPSADDRFARISNGCGAPAIRVENRGTAEITRLTVSYGYAGAEEATVSIDDIAIPYLESADILLPALPYSETSGTTFTVRIDSVNGAADEYGSNDLQQVEVAPTRLLPHTFEIVLRTNKIAALSSSNYELVLYDSEGARVISRSDFAAEQVYLIPVDLPDGCYRLELRNPEGFGLDYWPIREQIDSGWFYLRSGDGSIIEWFESDFGNSTGMAFRVPAPALEQSVDTVRFDPVPVGETRIETLIFSAGTNAPVTVNRVALFGAGPFRLIETRPEVGTGVTLAGEETLEADIQFSPGSVREFTTRMIVTSNDYRGTRNVQIVGVGDEPTSVEASRTTESTAVEVRDDVIRISAPADRPGFSIDVSVLDAVGRVAESRRFESGSNRGIYSIPTDNLASGTYIVLVTIGEVTSSHTIRIVR